MSHANAARTVEPGPFGGTGSPGLVWYTSYGSNMFLERLGYYIRGGPLPGTTRVYPGCRDRRLPVESMAVELPGVVYFATESPVWGGGRAFYDPAADGLVYARAHLVSAGQFSDIAAQEMFREPDGDLDLAEVLASGRAALGSGRYETLLYAGHLDGIPLLTFTAPWALDDVPWTLPSADYLRHFGRGLLEAGAWDVRTVASYVAARPGAAGHWSARAVAELIDGIDGIDG
ncbi:histone deacetylase [Streptomyces sp. BR1]|uniref:histone deacetylase n=1 Tax=Streptomyces sp. BR1 TaxID=1592323 RepID=UPI00402B578D